jgi:hypothetical protein
MLLSQTNHHARDDRITFIDEGHIYNVDGDTGFTSVTTFVHHFFTPFDATKVISSMKKSSKWETNRYFGMTDQEILDAWEANRNTSAASGTSMHHQIELFYNGLEYNTTDLEKEWEYFTEFNKGFGLTPYRTEWYVFDEENRLAGSIDMMYRSGDNDTDLVIVDWKRTAELKKFNPFQDSLFPLQHLPDCNYTHYCLQLNTYRYILQKHYGKRITAMYLIVIHPSNKSYQKHEVPVMEDEIRMMLEARKTGHTGSGDRRRLQFLSRQK